MPAFALSLLGPIQVHLDDEIVTQFSTAKVQALLAYLAVEANTAHPRDTLIGLFWPDYTPESARQNFRQTLFRLRQVIPQAYLLVTNQTVQFNTASDFSLDVIAFTELIAICHRHAHAELSTCADCSNRLQQAVQRYRGDFLAGFFLDDSPTFEEWLLLKREWLRREALHALAHLAQYHEQRDDYEQAYRYAWRQVELDPVREEAHQQLMRIFALTGRRSEALAQYLSCHRLLADELGVEPAPETTALYDLIRAGKFAPTGHPPIEESIPLRTPHSEPRTPPPPHNLPNQLTTFIGRAREIAEVKTLLSSPASPYDASQVRLLTLTGPGGSGKTRLAIQVAGELLNHYREGVRFVDLAPLIDPDLVLHVVCTSLEVREQPGRPLLDSLLDHLRTKHLLLVIDNCEHVIAACAQLIATLLTVSPEVQILATSREVLAVAGEVAWSVPGLARPRLRPLPSLEQIAQLDAVRLFDTRAMTAVPSFRLTTQNISGVAYICERLDGLPLALELAAARLRVLSMEEIAARLGDHVRLLATTSRSVPSRQQTLQATLNWSYGLLTNEEQTLLQQLAVFAGSWTLDAVEAICVGPPIHAAEILNLLARLVDKSLVVVDHQPDGTVRYRLLETIRQYARERLNEGGDAPARQHQHTRYYLALAEAAEPALDSAQQVQWYARLEMELDNLRTALAWSLAEPGQDEVGLRIAGALAGFWGRHQTEGRRWLEELLAHAPPIDTPARAKALSHAAWLAHYLYDWTMARSRIDECVAMSRRLGDGAQLVPVLRIFADIALNEGRLATGNDLITEAHTLCQILGDKVEMARIYQLKGRVAWLQGDNSAAQSHHETALALYREIGHISGQASTLAELGSIAFIVGDYASAFFAFEQALALYHKLEDRFFMALMLWALWLTAKLQDHDERAINFFNEFSALGRELGYELVINFRLTYNTRLAGLHGDTAQRLRLLAVLKLELDWLDPVLTTEARTGFTQIIAAIQESIRPTA